MSLLPDQAGLSLQGLDVPLDELGRAVVFYKPVRVDAEAVLVMSARYSSTAACVLGLLTMWRKLRGMPDPAMAQNRVCSVLGWELKKSQAESWAVAA